MKKLHKIVGCLSLLLFGSGLYAQITIYNYTGSIETYIVPDGVTSIQIEVNGAQGGGGLLGVTGGLGATIIGTFTVEEGDEFQILVGGTGLDGTNTGDQAGGTGGGGSYVVSSADEPVIIAGGGGGAMGRSGLPMDGGLGQITEAGQDGGTGGGAGGVDGNGGGTWPWPGWHSGTGGGGFYSDGSADSNGSISYGTINGRGKSFLSGGAGGFGGSMGRAGGFGGGGAAGFTGGGGGGYSGGGSGTHDSPITLNGGGGGSFNSGADQLNIEGNHSGNGQVIITVLCSPMTLVVSDYEICLGEPVTLDVDGVGTISWTGGVLNGVPFTPASTGTFTYNATSSSPLDCGLSVEIIVNELPNVTASVDETEICLGESVIFSNSGADTYTWDPADVTAGDPYSPTEGTATYVVTGINTATGCENTAEVEVTVYEELTITFTTVDEMAGADGEIDITVTGGNPAYSFDWDNDGTGDFDDTEDLTGLAGGTYVVVIEDEAGCSATETIVLNSQLGIEINVENNISIYPNPTTAHITILAAGSFTYEITDVNGQIVLVANGVDNEEVSLEELASGIYFVNLTIADELTTIRIVKN